MARTGALFAGMMAGLISGIVHGQHAAHTGPHAARTPAEMLDRMSSPDGCGGGFYFFIPMSMCLPRPQALGTGWVMLMGNGFLTDGGAPGPRGYHQIAAPHWLMSNAGVDLARWYRLELDVMLTAELWTLPDRGYPELLQIGEADAAGRRYIDAQHPHPSPLLGLALSQVFSLSTTRTRLLRLSFAPRGLASDGPLPFMHRPTGQWNPDAPLGHHIGQDVGHITSTVIGLGLYLGGTIAEVSTFHGQEPEPAQVNLPLGAPDSVALRVSQLIATRYLLSAAAAYVNDPEGAHAAHGDADDPYGVRRVPYVVRISASGYTHHDLPRGWRAHSALIWGGIAGYGGARFLNALTAEAVFTDFANGLWSRIEVLQRTPWQLAIPAPEPDDGRWVAALTLGYTRRIVALGPVELSVGGLGTLSLLDEAFAGPYGGRALLGGRLFLQARAMKMWHFDLLAKKEVHDAHAQH
jgi:hypothetical protein